MMLWLGWGTGNGQKDILLCIYGRTHQAIRFSLRRLLGEAQGPDIPLDVSGSLWPCQLISEVPVVVMGNRWCDFAKCSC